MTTWIVLVLLIVVAIVYLYLRNAKNRDPKYTKCPVCGSRTKLIGTKPKCTQCLAVLGELTHSHSNS
ncbi:hypothetical protein E5161_00875 [Cohnella pontilimi]|uniref:FeoB-associated Cys-rich membrane protein n=1 Tax=Cohnella pontilimi TaxID=2564100 RepID=A0A4U0FG63_9BACL|nr:hypothetical protein E5161_00875 [Cohnella pontilimi]